MKLPRRRFLHLAAGASALPAVLRSSCSRLRHIAESVEKIAIATIFPWPAATCWRHLTKYLIPGPCNIDSRAIPQSARV
jgi:hypothetical protein